MEYAALTLAPYSAISALGHPDHLKTRLRPPPCPGRTLSAIWNYIHTVTGCYKLIAVR